jgi:hypothetical protein
MRPQCVWALGFELMTSGRGFTEGLPFVGPCSSLRHLADVYTIKVQLTGLSKTKWPTALLTGELQRIRAHIFQNRFTCPQGVGARGIELRTSD